MFVSKNIQTTSEKLAIAKSKCLNYLFFYFSQLDIILFLIRHKIYYDVK